MIFLGSELSSDGRCSKEMRRRVALSGKNSDEQVETNHEGQMDATGDEDENCVVTGFPVALYDSESWSMTKRDWCRLDTFELRTVLVMGPEHAMRSNMANRTELNIAKSGVTLYYGYIGLLQISAVEKQSILGSKCY